MDIRYDVAIIGTGPGGVSAAITATLRGKKVLLLGPSTLSDKLAKAKRIDNYPGFPAISGQELGQRLQEHLAQMEIPICDKRIAAIYAMGSFFSIQAGEDMITAKTVILATGIVQGKVLPGEEAFLGNGVSYCATCDGRFYQDRTVAVVAYSAEAAAEATFLAELCQKVLYFPATRQAPLPGDVPNLEIIQERPIAITGTTKGDGLQTDKGHYDVDGIFVLRDAVQPDKLVPGLATDGPHIQVDASMATNIPGLFACGDITGKPYQYIKAAGQGNIAALSAVNYLATQLPEEEKE